MNFVYFCVVYRGVERWGSSNNSFKPSYLGSDFVKYRLISAANGSSVTSTLFFAASSSLVVDIIQTKVASGSSLTESNNLLVSGTYSANMVLVGKDLSSMFARKISLEIVNYPKYGNIISSNVTTVDAIITTELQYNYNRNSYRFTYPTKSFQGNTISCPYFGGDKLTLRLAAMNRTNQTEKSFSELFSLNVDINNINDPTTVHILVPTNNLRGSSSTQTYTTSQRIQKSIHAYSGGGGKFAENITLLTLAYERWNVVDPDCDLSPVRVRVNTTNNEGFISLSQSILDLLDFNSPTYCLQRSIQMKCRGDGQGDKDMVFVTSASDLTAVLRGITYYSFKPFSRDSITISVYDGEVS